ncbi:MAG TPA: hypothetical protein PKY81_07340 [bacterium]|nr:hypothetical protein [bacterium]
MKTTKKIFGIDIGTRTTIIYYFDTAKNTDGFLKIDGDDVISSAYTKKGIIGKKIREIEENEPSLKKTIIRDFKMDFWGRNSPFLSDKQNLKDFIEIILQRIQEEFPDDYEDSIFCFTYPSQRDDLINCFKDLIIETGKLKYEQIHTLDEASAATFGYFNFQKKDNSKFDFEDLKSNDKLMIIDIGAGTTDFCLLNYDKKNGFSILNSSSLPIAGNAFTKALSFFVENENTENFLAYFEQNPFKADEIKEKNFSNGYIEYKIKETWEEQKFKVIPQYCKLHCKGFEHFIESIKTEWKKIKGTYLKILKDSNINETEIKKIIPVGGGCLHTGLFYLMEDYFNSDNEKVTFQGKIEHCNKYVAIGAANYILKKDIKIYKIIPYDVTIEFPGDTYQPPVKLFHKGDVFLLNDKKIEFIPKQIWLKSNDFLAEGDIIIKVNNNEMFRKEIDIDWEFGGENDNHPGKIDYYIDIEQQKLNIKIELNNRPLFTNANGYRVKSGEFPVQIQLKQKGEYYK